MKIANFSYKLLKGCLFSLCLIATTNYASAIEPAAVNGVGKVYVQLSSYTTQLPGLQPKVVIMEHVDGISGLTLKSHKKIIVEHSGLYFIMATGQVGTKGIGVQGNVFLSLLKNDKILTSSSACYSANVNNTINNLISQVVIALKQGDVITVKVSSSIPLLGLVALQTKDTTMPSITFSMFQLASE